MQRPSIKMYQGRMNVSDFYELKDSPPAPAPSPASSSMMMSSPVAKPSSTFKIPSSSDLMVNDEPPSRPSTPPPSRFAYSFSNPPTPKTQPPSSSDDSILSNPRNIHCVVIADHIMECPICSRFYRNYTPIYNIIILILGIALIVLIIKCNNRSFPQAAAALANFNRPAPPTI